MSTNYPGNYPYYDVQNWTLAVVGNSTLVLKFKASDMEDNTDILKVFELNIL